MAPDDDCPSCGHAHAPGSTCHQCGHYRRCSESVERANGNGACGTTMDASGKEPIVEVIDKFLCIGAFEHTSNIDVLIKCGIRTVMNAVPACTPCCSSRDITVFTAPSDASDASALDLSATVRILEELHVKAERADDAFPSRVLVYCMTGHSRAPSVAVAYLMYSERRRLRDAVVALARRYPRGHTAVKIKPCDYQHLEAFEKTLFGENEI